MSKFTTAEFRKKLEEVHRFPSLYMFKFIITTEKKEEVKRLFPHNKISYKLSGKGKYISVTARVMMQSGNQVVEIYEKAQQIEGIIAL